MNEIPVRDCSPAAAAGMDSHEEGEWHTVWCSRGGSPPPSVTALLPTHFLALANRVSLFWPGTRGGEFPGSQCNSVPGLFWGASSSVVTFDAGSHFHPSYLCPVWSLCQNLRGPSHFCSSTGYGFAPLSCV